ncbi:hypothetical protein B0H10DRAFT_1948720 [Mycena sp. CBHHK59/15]|nr:hypothetical protein B0H10DRAFT_1948720 [Mycena sp. CBHHK59/15]
MSGRPHGRPRGSSSRGRGRGAKAKSAPGTKRKPADSDYEDAAPVPKRKKKAPEPVEPRDLPARSRKEHPGLPDAPRAKCTHEEKQADEAKKAEASADRQRRLDKAIAALAAINAEQDEAEAAERESAIYRLSSSLLEDILLTTHTPDLDDLLSDDMEVDELGPADDKDKPVFFSTQEDFDRIEQQDVYVPPQSEYEKLTCTTVPRFKKPARGETREAIEAATKVLAAGKGKENAVNAEPTVKKRGVQNSNAAAASNNAGLSKTWTKTRVNTQAPTTTPESPKLGRIDDDDADAACPAFAPALRMNNMVGLVASSDMDETPSRPSEAKAKLVRPTANLKTQSIKNERQESKIPALSVMSRTPTLVKSESFSSGTFTPAAAVDPNEMPVFVCAKWATVILPACYHAVDISEDPMVFGTMGKDLEEPGKEIVPSFKPCWTTYSGLSAASKYGGHDYSTPLESPIPSAHVRNVEKIAADARDALRPNGAAFYRDPTPKHACDLKPTGTGYIKPTGYLETAIIVETMLQVIKGHDFPIVVTKTADGDMLDFSQLPKGALGMSAAAAERAYKAHVTGALGGRASSKAVAPRSRNALLQNRWNLTASMVSGSKCTSPAARKINVSSKRRPPKKTWFAGLRACGCFGEACDLVWPCTRSQVFCQKSDESMEAFYDNEKPFSEFLEKTGATQAVSSVGMWFHSIHHIHPKQFGLSLDKPQQKIPNLTRNDFYNLFLLGGTNFTDRKGLSDDSV